MGKPHIKQWFDIHSCLGVTSGLLLFLVCWTGCFCTLSNEFDWLVQPSHWVERAETVEYQHLVDVAQNAYPAGLVTHVFAPLHKNAPVKIWVYTQQQQLRQIWVDPAVIEIVADTSRATLRRFFVLLHYSLFDPAGVGLIIVTSLSFPLLALLISALIFYKQWWRRLLTIRFGSGARAFVSSLHKLSGLWAVWFITIMVATGGFYLYEHIAHRFFDQKKIYAAPGEFAANPFAPGNLADRDPISLERAIDVLRETRPNLKVKAIVLNNRGYYNIVGQDGSLLVRDSANAVFIDRGTGQIAYNQKASDLPLYWRMVATADPLHFGNFGGLTTKLIWFVFGLGLSGLALSGVWLHVQRIERARGDAATRRGALTALGATSVLFVWVIAEGVAEFRSWGPMVDGARAMPQLAPGVA
ncbi:MAG: PepSY-associated TM helix domain-containing protein, partial [Pseudomonadota bacterium]